MATWKPELHDAESVLNYYDQYDEAGYSVYAGHKPDQAYCRFTYTGTDKSIGREKLNEALFALHNNPENTNQYLIQILAPKGKKQDVKNAITFQLNKAQSLMPYQPQIMGANNNALMQQLAAMESKINALQMQLEADEEDEEEDEPEENGILGSLMGNPAIKSMLINAISNLITPQPQANVTHVSGIVPETTKQTNEISEGMELNDQDSKIDEAIERLIVHDPKLGDDLLKLCEIAENDPKQFQMLLKMLRM